MVRGWTSTRCILLMAAAAMLWTGGLAQAQQAAHSAPAPTATTTHAPAGRTQPGRTTFSPGRSTRSGHAGFHANAQNGVQDPGVPRPTWELPRTVTPQWEIPNYNPVDPNPVQGNPRQHSAVGAALGGFVGYGAVPGYSFIDPTPADGDVAPNGAGPLAPSPGLEYGPAGSPPAYPGQSAYPSQAGLAADGSPEQGFAAQRRPPYRPESSAPPAAPAQNKAEVSDGLEHPEITLVFRDGRPPLKVRSYALTGTALLAVEDGHQTRVLLADLDLAATEARNRANGVDFSVPGGTR